MSEINKLEDILKDAPLGIIFKDTKDLFNPLIVPPFLQDRPEYYYAWLFTQPEYFYLTCKVLLNVKLHPFQSVILQQLWNHKLPMLVASRGCGKSFMLAVYTLLRMLLLKNRKVVICGAVFRQSKVIFDYMESIRNNSSILKQLIPDDAIKHDSEGYKMVYKGSSALAIPMSGDKTRGLRAHDIINDETSSVNIDVFETVVSGFASVSASPIENVEKKARQKISEKYGKIDLMPDSDVVGNQIILSGTAYYAFNHFAQYHERYRRIIKSRGDISKLDGIIKEGDTKGFNWKDYCIIRIPVELIPDGFMDDTQIARSRATISPSNYMMEYGACFVADSSGFFKRATIEECVVKPDKDIILPNGEIIPSDEAFFEPEISGDPRAAYIYGIDPAMSHDNFAIVILKLCGNHRKIVYVWTTNKDDHRNKLRLGISTENNYYAYCARKIRSLMTKFPPKLIALDAMGGGTAVMEALNDKNLIQPGEVELWPIIQYDKRKDTDAYEGLHIIDIAQFTKEEWTSQANHGLNKDFVDRVVLFPYVDAVTLIERDLASEDPNSELMFRAKEDNYDKLVYEIEELKNELCTITVSQTPNTNRERWDTPEVKFQSGKKGRLRKDRYSALLMANMTARTMERSMQLDFTPSTGGFANGYAKSTDDKKLFVGSSSLAKQLSDLYRNL